MVVQKSVAERADRKSPKPQNTAPQNAKVENAKPQKTKAENGGTRRTQAERRTAAKDGLLDAAAELFAEQGVTETSLAQIGERAGYSRGLANHHFGSKSELIERLVERVQTGFTDSLEISPSDNALEAILRIVRAYVAHSEVLSSDARALFVMWGASFSAESSVIGMAEADARTRATLATWIEQGQVDGSVSADIQPAAAAATLIGMLRGVVAQCLIDSAAFDLAAVQAECERMVTAWLTPSAPQAAGPTTGPNKSKKNNTTKKNDNTKNTKNKNKKNDKES